jgi:hypothetical protein
VWGDDGAFFPPVSLAVIERFNHFVVIETERPFNLFVITLR